MCVCEFEKQLYREHVREREFWGDGVKERKREKERVPNSGDESTQARVEFFQEKRSREKERLDRKREG